MLVQCPKCLTSYRVDDDRVSTPKPIFRCTRCHHIFELGLNPEGRESQETVPPPASAPEADEEESRELSFSFPPHEKTEEKEGAANEAVFTISQEKQPFTIPEEHQAPGPWTLPVPYPEFQEDLPGPLIPEEEVVSEQATETTPPLQEKSASTLPYLSLFGLLVIVYSLLTITHQSYPQTIESAVKAIPWLSSSVFRNKHLRRGIELHSLRPSFQTIVGNREVFVISGVAVNGNPVSVRELQVEASIYNREGKEIERQTISIGNPISSRIIRDLTAQEITILQKLSPQKRFEILPADSRGFAIVFLKSTKEIKEFSCRVSSAEGSV